MSGYRTVVIQDDNSSSVATNSSGSYPASSASSDTRTSSPSSSRSSLSGTTSHAALPPLKTSHCNTRPAKFIEETSNGKKEFVYTGRPQGGNPCGGPEQNLEGYHRVNCPGGPIIHNTGGRSRKGNPVRLGEKYGNGPAHCKECRDLSRWSDNDGLCFCPAL